MKYKTIYADPAWSYNNFQGKGKSHGDVSAHYKTLSIEEIKSYANKIGFEIRKI